MQTRGRRLRFTAVLVLVVLALTGFSSGRGRGGSHGGSGSGGGGCSSSSQDHDSSRSSTSSGGSYGSGGSSGGSYDSDDDDHASSGGGSSYTRRPNYGSTPTSSSGSGRALKDGTARLIGCATPAAPYATVEVRNPNGRKAAFSVSVTFEDAEGITVVDRYADVTVPANGTATVDVRVGGGSGLVDSVDHCEVDRQALVDD
ncbi:hypothetical protein ACFY9S_16580 [Streptomyces sp. NPDC012474]|uniref:hypothetical protein n=1 Tax=Streptomyces sp. NPDC012474 TaxID=3364836 RepID=UPI0036E4CC8B